MITAPFNFVPINKEVFFPLWSEDISHDVPFEDGESGEIELSICAKSPIFIKDSEDEESFCNYKGKHYIPSSSVKGMIRSVLEIMSFSKIKFVDDATYAVRDLRNRPLYMSKMTPENTFCGWLKKEGDSYKIEDCGIPFRIKYDEIDNKFNINFKQNFMQGTFNNANSPYKEASKRYELLNNLANEDIFKKVYTFASIGNINGKKVVNIDTTGDIKGCLVLTGQPSARNENGNRPSGKIYDFVFEKKEEPAVFIIDKKVVENFKFAYFDSRDTQPKESPDWMYWKEKLYKGEKIPVFFQKEGTRVEHFGLSYLYKLPYKHSVHDGIPNEHFEDRLDLAESIFGYVNKKDALKGRVNFSHFRASSNVTSMERRSEVLGTPRASYYPMYVQQHDGNLYKTFMDADFSIAGRKRYPIHKGNATARTEDTGNENIGTTFTPLKEGIVFSGKMRYHNLKKAELGALLSAISFHNTANTFHSIGLAKALGYGKIKITIKGIDDIESYLKEFEMIVSEQVSGWKDSQQLKELLSMAVEQNNAGSSALKYMKLEQFAKAKTSQEYLKPYTQLADINSVSLKSLVTQEDRTDLERRKELYKQEQERLLEKQKEKKVFEDVLLKVKDSKNIQVLENFIEKYPEYEGNETLKDRLSSLKNDAQENKFEKVDESAKNAYVLLLKKKGNQKQFKKEAEKFIKKWDATKNNKGSTYVLELISKVKAEV